MAVNRQVRESIAKSAWIRGLFEEGARMRQRWGAEHVYDFSLGNPDLEPPDSFFSVLADLLADPAPGRHGYMPNAGFPEVRAAVAASASEEQGIEIPGHNILMTAGAAAGLNVVFATILDPGDEVVVPAPFFPEYTAYVAHGGGRLVPVPTDRDFLPDPEAIAAALGPRTAALLLNSPNNPTGRIYPAPLLGRIAGVLRSHGERSGRHPCVVSDEPYRKIVYGTAQVPSVMEAFDRCVVATSWSKSLSLAGERIGYLAVSPRFPEAGVLVDGLVMTARTRGFVNALMQRAVHRLLDARIDAESYGRRGRELAAGLRAAGYACPDPEGGLYLFCRVPPREGRSGESAASPQRTEMPEDVEFLAHLRDFRILGAPGSGVSCPGWFRLCFAVPRGTIEGAIPAFARAIEAWKVPHGSSVAVGN